MIFFIFKKLGNNINLIFKMLLDIDLIINISQYYLKLKSLRNNILPTRYK